MLITVFFFFAVYYKNNIDNLVYTLDFFIYNKIVVDNNVIGLVCQSFKCLSDFQLVTFNM